MQQIWRKCKAYFGDGFVTASSPLRYDVHICDIERPLIKNDNHHYGVELDEETLPLFPVFGESRPPPCSCHELQALASYIDNRLETMPDSHPGDYSLHTGKGDTSPDEVCVYALRDALGWWVHWHGTVATSDRWKHLCVAFASIPDEVQIPPSQLVDGTWRCLGYTLADLLTGLRSEGMHPDDVTLIEMCFWRQYVLQYLEKVDPGLRALVVGKTTLMTYFRTLTAGTHPAAVCLAAARGAQTRGISDQAVEMSSIGDCLSMDMAKEVMGILQGEKTESVAGNRVLLKQELRWAYVRCMSQLDAQPDGHLLRRYASSGFHFVPTMDRYLERVGMVRWPLAPAMRRLICLYAKGNAAACVEHM